MYFIGQGRIETFKSMDSITEYYIQTFGAGQMFGEVTALFGCDSDESYVCATYCKIAKLKINDYLQIEKEHPQMRHRLLKRMRVYL